ncbi:hypothetical protein [Spirosoma migulaei]
MSQRRETVDEQELDHYQELTVELSFVGLFSSGKVDGNTWLAELYFI